jgi:hypothetical protein
MPHGVKTTCDVGSAENPPEAANRTLNWLHGEPLSMIGSTCFLVDQRDSCSLRSAAHIIPT